MTWTVELTSHELELLRAAVNARIRFARAMLGLCSPLKLERVLIQRQINEDTDLLEKLQKSPRLTGSMR